MALVEIVQNRHNKQSHTALEEDHPGQMHKEGQGFPEGRLAQGHELLHVGHDRGGHDDPHHRDLHEGLHHLEKGLLGDQILGALDGIHLGRFGLEGLEGEEPADLNRRGCDPYNQGSQEKGPQQNGEALEAEHQEMNHGIGGDGEGSRLAPEIGQKGLQPLPEIGEVEIPQEQHRGEKKGGIDLLALGYLPFFPKFPPSFFGRFLGAFLLLFVVRHFGLTGFGKVGESGASDR